ncbi:hypothetical protein AAFC00_004075 [Neodothiora populina]|uniref:AB hydrolase-1 domain-containing protein n=1 Tax=Neodothiora populina TaxID=2781224 RepID=A0ABR3PIS8_9PEZI
MSVDKITPDDPRVTHEYVVLNGHRYHYLLGVPKNGQYRATIFLVHGWPDLSFGWRYQIPFFMDQGLRVVVPDQMGYGQTDAPRVPPEDISLYGFKRAADNMAELAKILNAPKIILGGHDWGGLIVYRFAQWHPTLVTHVLSVCTPYLPPADTYKPMEKVVPYLPQFGYQLQLAGPEPEAKIQSRESVSKFLSAMYGGRSPDGQFMFSPEKGIDFDIMNKSGKPLLLDETELEYYTSEYMRSGMHGPLNWYRTREANFKDELGLKNKNIDQPVLFIAGTKDSVLKPEMSLGMEEFIPHLSRGEVATSHWALTQAPKEVNEIVKGWLDNVVFGAKSSL